MNMKKISKKVLAGALVLCTVVVAAFVAVIAVFKVKKASKVGAKAKTPQADAEPIENAEVKKDVEKNTSKDE